MSNERERLVVVLTLRATLNRGLRTHCIRAGAGDTKRFRPIALPRRIDWKEGLDNRLVVVVVVGVIVIFLDIVSICE